MGISPAQGERSTFSIQQASDFPENGCISLPEENLCLRAIAECPSLEKFQSTAPFFSSLWAPQFPSTSLKLESPSEERQAQLGPYLSSLPVSAEERIPTDESNALLANTVYSLSEAWVHLPQPLRVYLDQLQLKSESGLLIGYESPSENFPDGRWRVSKENPQEAVAAGLGMLGLGLLNRSSTPKPPSSPHPDLPPSVNFKIGNFIAGVVLVVGIDFGIRKTFPFLPQEARTIPNLASFYGFQYVLWQSGMIQAASWKEVWKPTTAALPAMVMLGIPTSMLVDRIGRLFELESLRSEGFLHAPVTMISGLALYFKLLQSPAGRNFITASGTGLSSTLGRIVRVAGSALILSAIAKGARSGSSYLGLYMGGSRPGEFTWQDAVLTLHAEKIALAQASQNMFGQGGGAFVDGVLGGLVDLVISVGGLVSEQIERGREMAINDVKELLIDEGHKAAQEIKEKLSFALSDSMQANGNIDWNQFQEAAYEIYSSEEVMMSLYQVFSLIAHRESAAGEIPRLIDSNGNLLNRLGMQQMAQDHAKQWLNENQSSLRKKQSDLEALGASIGNLKVENKQITITPPELLSPQQQARVESEYLPLSGEIAPLEMQEEAMLKLTKQL